VAVKRLASEVPEAFVPSTERVRLFKDYTDATMTRLIDATTDKWVLDLGLNTVSAVVPAVDGTWDGVMWLEVTDPTGAVQLVQSREWWLHKSPPYADHYLVSITTPWRNNSDLGMAFRIFQPEVFFRDDVMKLVDGAIYDSNRQLLQVLPQNFTRNLVFSDFQGASNGRPLNFSRRSHFQLPAPNRAPTTALDTAVPVTTWAGPEAWGTFKYKYTYVWGKKDENKKSPGGSYDPMWESSPSPPSAAVTVPDATAAVEVTNLVDIDWQIDFNPTVASLRSLHSGLRKRIYRTRTAVTAGGGNKADVEAPDIYYFLAEVEGDVTSYVDRGEVIPEYYRRIPESHGYFGYASTPHQDTQYEVDFRVDRRPLSLLNDSDAPQVHPQFEDMLLLLVMRYLAEMQNKAAEAADYEAQYKLRVLSFRGEEANPADYVPPVPWAPDVNQNPVIGPVYGVYRSS
jgi:hypothetical protein